jgi:hypothetical protein
MQSVISYPSRGNYGKSNYRGNCSGHVIKDLINHFNPKDVVDTTLGGNTSADVCSELGIPFHGLDIYTGFDVTQHSIYKAIGNRFSDMVFSHPPYHDMIKYETERKKHGLSTFQANDLSNCRSVEEFREMSQIMLVNQRHATAPGGHYATLIGDYRKNGNFYSFQADYQAMMPRNELKGVVIKMQHNTTSGSRTYSGSFIPIQHEYLLVWQRSKDNIFSVMYEKAEEFKQFITGTWKNVVRLAIMNLGGEAALSRLYKEIESLASDKIKSNPNYKAKIRQTLQKYFSSVERGVWGMA